MLFPSPDSLKKFVFEKSVFAFIVSIIDKIIIDKIRLEDAPSNDEVEWCHTLLRC